MLHRRRSNASNFGQNLVFFIRDGEGRGGEGEVRETQVEIEADVVSWMDLWSLEHMPEEREGDPHERQEHHAQCELFAKVIVNAHVPV